MQLRDLYCLRFGCDLKDFEANLVKRYLNGAGRMLSPVIVRYSPDYFSEELVFARYVGRQVDLTGVQLEVDLYHAKCVELSFVRKWCGVRLGCRRLIEDSREMIKARDDTFGDGEDGEHPQGKMLTMASLFRSHDLHAQGQ